MMIDLERFDAEDMSALHIANAGGAQHMLLSGRDFRLRSSLIGTSRGGIIHAQYSAAMRVQQGIPKGMYFVGFVFDVRGRFVADGVPLTGGEILIFPPGSEVSAVMNANFEWAMALVPEHVMRERALDFAGRDIEAIAPEKRLVTSSESGPALRERQAAALSQLRRLTRMSPSATDQPENGDDWIENALQLFLETPLAERSDRRAPRSFAIFRKVEEYLEAHAHRTIYMHELCAAAGVSGRHIRAAFEEVVGVPPNRYLELIRLARAREHLKTAPSVKYAALSSGNIHLSRFSEHYQRLFGELPSDTFARERAVSP